ncbi:MAG: conjugal transfer protein TraX, partial [Clostridiales bacterium]|nr:conjugal transfer protein TraX [Clostridiales bacterium]
MGETIVVEKKPLEKISYRNDALKILAMVTMFIDHVGYMFFPGQMLYRTIGRLAFPIFAYQIAIGYSKTSNLKKYVERLFIFALITQIPYSFFNSELSFNPLHFNVLFMFLAAIAVVYIYDLGVLKIKSFIESRNYLNV